MKFKNKIVWITGASSGIGESLAYAFANEGADLILSSRNEKELIRVKNTCSNNARAIQVIPLDVSDHQGVFDTAEKLIAERGAIDILVSNAGISQRGLAKDTQFSVDKRIMDVDYFGTIALTKAVLPAMLAAKSGQIVVTTSVTGLVGIPGRSTYSAAKHALHGYFDALRAEVWRENVKVLLVVPGYIKTNISFNALTESGQPQNKMDDGQANGIMPDVLAQKILRAIATGKEELHVAGFRESLAIFVKRFFPRLFSKIVRKAKTT